MMIIIIITTRRARFKTFEKQQARTHFGVEFLAAKPNGLVRRAGRINVARKMPTEEKTKKCTANAEGPTLLNGVVVVTVPPRRRRRRSRSRFGRRACAPRTMIIVRYRRRFSQRPLIDTHQTAGFDLPACVILPCE